MKSRIHYKKAVLAGILVIIINMIIGNLLYMNPIVAGTYKAYEGHPSIQPMETFGGEVQWVLLTLAFRLILTIFFMILYLGLYNGLPGTAGKKGCSTEACWR